MRIVVLLFSSLKSILHTSLSFNDNDREKTFIHILSVTS